MDKLVGYLLIAHFLNNLKFFSLGNFLGRNPKIFCDEVYQAVLEAGSGGIRYNDSTKTIQLMDVNKNWVDWKKYDAYSRFELATVAFQNSSTAALQNYTFDKNGVYIAFAVRYNGSAFTINTTATQFNPITVVTTATRYLDIVSIDATVGDTITISSTSASSIQKFPLVYIGSGISNITLVEGITVADNPNSPISITTSTANTIVIGAISAVSGYTGTITVTSSNTRDFTSDGKTYACWTNFYESGNCTIKAYSQQASVAVASLKIS